MEREKIELKTKSGVEFKAHTYITGREMRELRDCYITDVDVQVNNTEGINLSGVKADTIRKYEDMSVGFIILSLNGSDENIVDAVGDLPIADYDDIMDHVTSLTNSKKDKSDTSKA